MLHWGSVVVPSWHLFFVLGAFSAYGLLVALSGRLCPSVPRTEVSRLFVICYVAGYLGARILSIFIEGPVALDTHSFFAEIMSLGPMTFYGGALLSALCGFCYIKARHLPVGSLFDAGVTAGLLGLAFGRVGCFLNGDDYGRVFQITDGGSPPGWTVVIPVLGDGLHRWPVQLFESAGCLFFVAWVGFWIFRAPLRAQSGTIAFAGAVFYANLRFLLEFLRDDFRGFVFGTWLSTSQFISLLLLLFLGILGVRRVLNQRVASS